MTGCPSNGSDNSFRLFVNFFYSGTNHVYNDYGDGVTCQWDNIPDSGAIDFSVMIRIKSGTTVSNLTFYPMIRDARIKDDTFAPYAMTNSELTENVVGKPIQATNRAWTGNSLTFADIPAHNGIMYRFSAMRSGGEFTEYMIINRVDGLISFKIAGNVDCTFTVNSTTMTVTLSQSGFWCYQLIKLNNYN